MFSLDLTETGAMDLRTVLDFLGPGTSGIQGTQRHTYTVALGRNRVPGQASHSLRAVGTHSLDPPVHRPLGTYSCVGGTPLFRGRVTNVLVGLNGCQVGETERGRGHFQA